LQGANSQIVLPLLVNMTIYFSRWRHCDFKDR